MGRIKDEELFRLIKNFLTIYLPVQCKASPHTVNNYRIVLDQLLTFTASMKKISFIQVTSDMICRETIEAYLDHLISEKNLSTATRNNRLASIKSFLKYAAALKPEYVSLMADIATIKKQKDDQFSKVDYMTEDAVTAILNEPDTGTKIGIRDLFFMIILYDTGGRIQEIIDIKINEIKTGKTPSVLLHGKGGKDRIVPLMERTMEHFKKYMSVFHPNKSYTSNDYLFYSHKNGINSKICDDTIRIRMNIYAASAREQMC